MKKRVLAVLMISLFVVCVSTSASASTITEKHIADYYDSPHVFYFNLEKAIELWSERYHISPEMIQAVSELDAYMTEAYGKFVYEVARLHYLYEEYEDNYIVLDKFFPTYAVEFGSKDEMINHILDRARQLEKEHGKI